jgi:hypothetical protein
MPAKIAFAGEKTYTIYIRGSFKACVSSVVDIPD